MNILKRLFSRNNFLEWNDYKKRIDTLDQHLFQQSVRKHNLRQ